MAAEITQPQKNLIDLILPITETLKTIEASQEELRGATETSPRTISPVLLRDAILYHSNVAINNIGIPNEIGYGVGICPALPTGMSPLPGTFDKAHDNYGNYIYTDGSIMVWIPLCFMKWGTGSNGLAVNYLDVKPASYFSDVTAANAAGYFVDRAFYNAGKLQLGVFVDKYQCSKNGAIASSLKNGNPLSSNAAHNPFSGLTGAPIDAYYGAIIAAKTRGANFFPNSIFIFKLLARLSYAHALAATSSVACGWYDATGVTNFPKGNNNNALRDTNDSSVLYTSDGYSNCGKTGSGTPFNKTTHNGQNSGICDLNGNMWEIGLGLTSDGSNFYLLKTSVDMKSITASNTLATDAWGATGIAALYDSLGATYEALTASSSLKNIGSANQVFSEAVSGNAWNAAGAGIPLLLGTGGTNQLGNDGLWDYKNNDMCPILGGSWNSGASAGVWALYLSHVRASSNNYVGFRSALYLD